MPPTYRHRLRLEGTWLAVLGVAGSALLLATTDEARRWPLNTVGQLALTAGIAIGLSRRATHRSIEHAPDREPGELGSGEPTPLWMHPLIVAGLAAAFPLAGAAGAPGAGFDASLRITAGCAIVGLTQAVYIERIVAAAERERDRRYFRASGSHGMKTVLEATRGTPA